jgi:hemerythrin-like domain-containing protein
MNPIAQLKNEHEAVRTALAILEKLTIALEHSASDDTTEDLDSLLEFLQVFVDRCHHSKEEQLLFPALEEVGIGRDGGPIGVMLAEHRQGREAIQGMVAALHRCRRGESGAAAQFALHARAYGELLDRHIDKENNVLFVLAERHLSPKQLTMLESGFDRLEEEEIGTGKHEAFHRMLDDLATRYLDAPPVSAGEGKAGTVGGCSCTGRR